MGSKLNSKEVEVRIRSTNEIEDLEKSKIKKLVEEGGQVCMKTFDKIWNNDTIIATIQINGTIVSCGALKIPNKEYKERLFSSEKASSPLNSTNYKYELGWLVTSEPFRKKGLCSRIIDDLLGEYCEHNLYATVREYNSEMQNILLKRGFSISGNKYKSEKGEYYLSLYVQEKQ